MGVKSVSLSIIHSSVCVVISMRGGGGLVGCVPVSRLFIPDPNFFYIADPSTTKKIFVLLFLQPNLIKIKIEILTGIEKNMS
jgi:hypothetical protein